MKLSELQARYGLHRAESDCVLQLSGKTRTGHAVHIFAGPMASSVPRRRVAMDEYTHVEVAFASSDGGAVCPGLYAGALPGWDGTAFMYVPVATLNHLLRDDLAND